MLSQYKAAIWVRICICLILAKIFADVRLLMYLILVIFCDTKGFQLLNFATFFKLVLHGNKYIYQITNLLTVNKLNNYLSNIISRSSDWISINFFLFYSPHHLLQNIKR